MGSYTDMSFSHTLGEDGPSQMALEDLAMFRSIPKSTVFYPSDGVATEKAVHRVGHDLSDLAAAAASMIYFDVSCK